MASKEYDNFNILVKNEQNLVKNKSLEIIKEQIVFNNKKQRLLDNDNE